MVAPRQIGPQSFTMPIPLESLPAVNAALNALAAVLLVVGYRFIKQRRERAHKATMLAAFGVSLLFLTCYVIYHLKAPLGSVRFQGPPLVRGVYLAMLFTHVVLAAAVPVLAGVTTYFGLRDQRARHRRIARWTLPIWLYVSVTGVIIYVMLYQLYPPAAK